MRVWKAERNDFVLFFVEPPDDENDKQWESPINLPLEAIVEAKFEFKIDSELPFGLATNVLNLVFALDYLPNDFLLALLDVKSLVLKPAGYPTVETTNTMRLYFVDNESGTTFFSGILSREKFEVEVEIQYPTIGVSFISLQRLVLEQAGKSLFDKLTIPYFQNEEKFHFIIDFLLFYEEAVLLIRRNFGLDRLKCVRLTSFLEGLNNIVTNIGKQITGNDNFRFKINDFGFEAYKWNISNGIEQRGEALRLVDLFLILPTNNEWYLLRGENSKTLFDFYFDLATSALTIWYPGQNMDEIWYSSKGFRVTNPEVPFFEFIPKKMIISKGVSNWTKISLINGQEEGFKVFEKITNASSGSDALTFQYIWNQMPTIDYTVGVDGTYTIDVSYEAKLFYLEENMLWRVSNLGTSEYDWLSVLKEKNDYVFALKDYFENGSLERHLLDTIDQYFFRNQQKVEVEAATFLDVSNTDDLREFIYLTRRFIKIPYLPYFSNLCNSGRIVEYSVDLVTGETNLKLLLYEKAV